MFTCHFGIPRKACKVLKMLSIHKASTVKTLSVCTDSWEILCGLE